MDLGLNGRNAVVCASSQGLGRACALELARAGCTVVVNGRDAETLERTAAEIRQESGGTVIAVAADVATPEGQEALLAAVPHRRHPGQQQRRAAAPRLPADRPGGAARRGGRQHGGADRAGPAGDRRHGRAAVRPDRQHHLGFGRRCRSKGSTCRAAPAPA